jgi:hypothetical protein
VVKGNLSVTTSLTGVGVAWGDVAGAEPITITRELAGVGPGAWAKIVRDESNKSAKPASELIFVILRTSGCFRVKKQEESYFQQIYFLQYRDSPKRPVVVNCFSKIYGIHKK